MIFKKFIAGLNVQQMSTTLSAVYKEHTWLPIIDYAREGAYSHKDVTKYMDTVKTACEYLAQHNSQILKPMYAFKLSSFENSHIHPGIHMRHLANHILNINPAAKIVLDAEDYTRTPKEDTIYAELIADFNKDYVTMYKTYQMYRKDSMQRLIVDMGTHANIGIKLVRGAYFYKDRHLLCNTLQETHQNYDEAVTYVMTKIMLGTTAEKDIRLMIATHNKKSIDDAILYANSCIAYKNTVCFAQLYGMGDNLSKALVEHGLTTYKYMPFGEITQIMPYLTRRLIESNMLKLMP